jgi:hypothetical protein
LMMVFWTFLNIKIIPNRKKIKIRIFFKFVRVGVLFKFKICSDFEFCSHLNFVDIQNLLNWNLFIFDFFEFEMCSYIEFSFIFEFCLNSKFVQI